MVDFDINYIKNLHRSNKQWHDCGEKPPLPVGGRDVSCSGAYCAAVCPIGWRSQGRWRIKCQADNTWSHSKFSPCITCPDVSRALSEINAVSQTVYMKNLPVNQFFCGKSSDQLIMADRHFVKGGDKKNVKCLCKNGQNGDPAWKKSCSWDFRGDTWGIEQFKTVECKDKDFKIDVDDDEVDNEDEDVEETFKFSVWGVNANDQIWYKSSDTDMWKKIPGGLKQIEVGKLGVFGINKNDAIFYRTGTNNSYSSGTGWQRLPGSLKHISVGDSSIWGVSKHDRIYEMTDVVFDAEGKISNPKWTRIQGGLDNVSVYSGVIWGVSSADRIWFKSSSDAKWEQIPGGLKQVEIGNFGVFGVNKNNDIYYRVGTHNNPSSSGSSWQKLYGKLKYISSGHSTAWGVNDADLIWKMTDISFDDEGKIQFKWVRVQGKLKNVSNIENGVEPDEENGDAEEDGDAIGSDVAVWGVNSDEKIWFKSHPEANWERIPGGLKQIEVGKLGVFGVNRNDAIYYRVGSKNSSRGDSWQRLPGALRHISVGDSSIWGVNKHDRIYEMTDIVFDDEGKISNPKWARKEGGLDNVSVYSGVIWGVNSQDSIWFKSNSDAKWQKIPGGLKQIEIGKFGVFGVNKNDNIFYRIGTNNNPNSTGSGWQRLPGRLTYISSGESTAWGVNSSDLIWRMSDITFDADGKIQFKWTRVDGKLKNISIN